MAGTTTRYEEIEIAPALDWKTANTLDATAALDAIEGLIKSARWDLARGRVQIMMQHAQSIQGHCNELTRIAGCAEILASLERK